jgi:hypothetical protein
MDHIRTPDTFSETMSTAYNISETNRVLKRVRDADSAVMTSARHFQVAEWDPCYNLDSTDFLRNSNFKMGSKVGSIKNNHVSDAYKYDTSVTGGVNPSLSHYDSSISPYPCEKTDVTKLFQECTSAKSRLARS